MPYVRPALGELVSRIEADLTSRLQIDSPLLRRALVRVIARASAGGMHGVHGHIDWAARQLFATTADAEMLDIHGAELGLARRVATFATGNVTFTGTNGVVIASGTRVQRADGAVYETTAAGTTSGGAITVAAIALAAGLDGNADAGVALSLVTPIANIASDLVVASGGLSGGVDPDTDDEFRQTILSRKRNPPQGGADADYIKWAKEIAGVTRVWVYGNYMGPGTVGVTFVMDGLPDIIPDSGTVAAVQAYLSDRTRKPITAQVDVFAPTPVPLDVTLHVSPDTADVRAAVVSELQDLLLRDGEPGVTLLLTHIREAISAAAGEEDHVLATPSANVAHDPSELPVLGTVTFT